MRGISGSGKSTVAKVLASSVAHGMVVSTDSFFVNSQGEYKFDRAKLGQYHQQNYEYFNSLVSLAIPIVVVDNTNVQRKEFQKYVDAAKRYGYEVFEITVGNPWRQVSKDMRMVDDKYVDECAARNAHGVPREVIYQQALRFET